MLLVVLLLLLLLLLSGIRLGTRLLLRMHLLRMR